MGDETMQFASRFSSAASCLARLAAEDGHAELLKLHGRNLSAAVHDALDAIAAVYRTDTSAVRSWPEQRKRVLALVATMRARLDAAGVGDEVRRTARTLVDVMGASGDRDGRAAPRRPRR